jgi:ABC-type lipoprotein release transport system permease subunit
MTKHVALFLNATASLFRSRARNIAAMICLVALLSPFVAAIAISEGMKEQHERVLFEAGDVYVARDNYGSNAPVELSLSARLSEVQGVIQVVPRIVGRVYARGKLLTILGVGPRFIPSSLHMVEGRKSAARGDVIIGKNAANYLEVGIGSRFSLKRNPKQVFEIVGIFDSPYRIWNADLMVMGFDDASDLFGMSSKATDLVVHTRPGYEQIVNIIIRMSEEEAQSGLPPLRVQTKDLIHRYSVRGFNLKAGVFSGFYCLVLALGIPCLGVISGFGLSERRREIGIMKALGWTTQDVLEMVALENLILAGVSAVLVVGVAAAWVHFLNGAGIARFFIPGLGILVPFDVPARIFPVPAVFGLLTALILTMVGSIHSTWKTAVASPAEAMKR